MSVIAPCITTQTPEDYKSAVERIQPFAQRVHVDVSDGEFAPNFLLPLGQLWWPKEWTVDLHLMVTQPSQHLANLLRLHPNLVILHAESNEDILPTLTELKKAGIKAGVGLLKTTVPSVVKPLIEASDHVMIFSGELGKYGGVASLMQLEKIRLIKAINPNVEIGWDGGVALDNAFTLAQGGVDVLNAGGAIASAEDPGDTYHRLEKEINKRGII
jgi:ribulose-phosphate 3-epimerase